MTDSSDIYLNELKRGGRKGGKINLSKAQVEDLKIVQSLPISNASKEILLKLIKKHQLLSIDKIVKNDKRSLMLFGKFGANEVTIKIYKINVTVNEVEIVGGEKCNARSIVLYQEGNVFVMENLKGLKTIEEMMKENPSKIEEYCREVLELIHTAKHRHYYFWNAQFVSRTKMIFYDNSWYCINFDAPRDYSFRREFDLGNVIEIFETFRENGVKVEKLWQIFLKAFKRHDYNKMYVCNDAKIIEQKYFIEHKRNSQNYI